MKIAMIVDIFNSESTIGGGDIVAQNTAEGLTKKGHEIIVICSGNKKVYSYNNFKVYQILTNKCKWKTLKCFPFLIYSLKDRLSLNKVLKSFKPLVLLCLHQRQLMIPTIFFINQLSFPKLYRFGDEWLRLHYYNCKYDLERFWNRNSFLAKRQLDLIENIKICKGICKTGKLYFANAFCNSLDLSEMVVPFLGENTVCRIINNGIDLKLFRFVLNQKHDHLKLLFIGRLVYHKDVHRLLEMVRLLVCENNFENTILTIVGTSEDSEYIELLATNIKDFGLEKNIKLEGGVKHNCLPKFYNSHDFFLYPSATRNEKYTIEGCPSVILEAMASGIPVIAVRSKGVNEETLGTKTCMFIDNDQPNSFISKIKYLYFNESAYMKQVLSARSHILENNNLEKYLKNVLEYLGKLI